jgi:hypothetical protein
MAASEYYHQSPSEQPVMKANKERPISHIAFAYNTNPSSSTIDQSRLSQGFTSRPMSTFYEPYDSTRQSVHSDSIPLKHKSRIFTEQDAGDWRQSPHYPPSPESNNPQLLPDSKGRKKVEGSFGNFFKGKIPWVVYTLSLIQISVFIAEIIKNCEHTLLAGVQSANNW